MVDTLTPAERSAVMARVHSKNTGPEMFVRRMLFSAGYRYRIHVTNLPGKPDLVFLGRKKVIFVHGCFWHGHQCKMGQRLPKSRIDFWSEKIKKNKARDKRNRKDLKHLGWNSLVVWECQLANAKATMKRITRFLEKNNDT